MLFEAQEVVKQATNSGVTGRFVLDGALLIAGFKAAEAAIRAVATKLRPANSNGKTKPGDGETCRNHGEAIAKLVEFKDNANDALKRIEGKVDRLLEK